MGSPASDRQLMPPPGTRTADVRVMIVVAHDRLALYEQFKEAFKKIDTVQVILDRRIASSHVGDALPSGDPGRRWEPDVYDELLLRGFVLRRVPRVAPQP